MITTPDNAPEVVVESLDKSEERWRMATLGVLALAGFLCVCFSAVLVLNLTQSGAFQAGRAASPTRVAALFANTWTPTPTDTASPTAPPRPTVTETATQTATPTDTATPDATQTFTPWPTPRPHPTNTSLPPPPPPPPVTNTPHATQTTTSTPAPTVSYALRVTQVRTFSANCCSVGVFGTVRNNLNALIPGIAIRLIREGSSSAFQVMTTGKPFGSANDRNYEMSTANGIGPGTYTLLAVDSAGRPLSPSTSLQLCTSGHHCAQWYQVDFQQ